MLTWLGGRPYLMLPVSVSAGGISVLFHSFPVVSGFAQSFFPNRVCVLQILILDPVEWW